MRSARRVRIAMACPPNACSRSWAAKSGSAIDPDCFAALESVLQTAPGRALTDNTPAARSVAALAEDYSQAA